MAYFAPYIDSTGMHIPTYNDIRDDLIASMKTIFGNEIYIDEDTQDYQQISIFAKKIFDTNALALLTYNNRTVNTAIGVGLDNICALVGITRKPATYSSVQVTLTGDPSTVITDGKVGDGTYTWNLPSQVTIPANGIITVEAQCSVSGSITAAPNSITNILTPVYGWLSVVNNYSAQAGTDVETDSELRARFQLATSSPSSTVFESILASLQSVNGVTRVKGYENDTNVTDPAWSPPHSVTFVVEGGDEEEVATQIYYKKTPGCYTNGTTEVQLTSQAGNISIIRFYRPTYVPVYVKVSLTKLSSYNDIYEQDIKNAIVDYINNLEIAENVYRSILWSVATSQMTSINAPSFSITEIKTSTDGQTFSPADISIDFNQAASITADNIVVEVS